MSLDIPKEMDKHPTCMIYVNAQPLASILLRHVAAMLIIHVSESTDLFQVPDLRKD